ncbi:hypothetical protein M3Y94_00948200 [Aphelenchoides besseyi]|nr:hypothetical protein M3Y94_00948200 [Aphelenchoides besseyi]KAI6224835.1 hypothetical protein M3Y95_00794400 [Aphelenchoides besseyi]
MIETFVRLIDGRRDGKISTWQGVLTFSTNAPVQALAALAIRSASTRIEVEDHDWRFMIFNRKFDEYCDIVGSEKDKRLIADGDKFEIVYTPKECSLNLWSAISTVAQDEEQNGVVEETNGSNDQQRFSVLQSSLNRQRQNGRSRRSTNRINGPVNSTIPRNNNEYQTPTIFAEIRPRSPILFTDNQPEVKPSLEFLNRLTATRRVSSSSPSESAEMQMFEKLPIRRSTQPQGERSESPFYDDNSNFSSRQTSVDGLSRKRTLLLNDDSNFGLRNSEDAPCVQHSADPELCSHTRFRNVDANDVLRRSNQGDIIIEHLQSLADNDGAVELDQTVRCKLMNIIGHFLMVNSDTVGLPTAVERRILVSNFLAQLPYQLDTKVFTNRAGTGCLDYWVRNRRKTTLREDGVFMVRGSKRRTVPKNADFILPID